MTQGSPTESTVLEACNQLQPATEEQEDSEPDREGQDHVGGHLARTSCGESWSGDQRADAGQDLEHALNHQQRRDCAKVVHR